MNPDAHNNAPGSPLALSLLAAPGRLSDIAMIDLFNPMLRQRLDTIARQTRTRQGRSVSLITLVLDSAQHVAGSDGLQGWIATTGGTPVEWSFCANAVLTGQPYVVEDATQDPRHKTNPLVTQDGISSYCGVPIVSTSGHILGAHCVIDDTPQRYTLDDVTALQEAACEINDVIDEFRTGELFTI
jgi:GAF domain-containing protein